MEAHETGFETSFSSTITYDEDTQVKKGPWSPEEDSLLLNYIQIYGEGKWDSLARQAGLRRTGKSCRLRWLNYLRPDLRRGNVSLQEQLLILELHSRWGNRWSKIAQYLPGRTDNEIKNYWRTRVQKQAKLLNCDANSKQFNDILRHVWIPRLIEQIQASSESSNLNSGRNNELGSDSFESSSMPVLSSGTSSGSMETQVSNLYDSTECDNQVLEIRTSELQQESVLYPGWGDQDGVDIRICEQAYGSLGGEDSSLQYMWNEDNIWSF